MISPQHMLSSQKTDLSGSSRSWSSPHLSSIIDDATGLIKLGEDQVKMMFD